MAELATIARPYAEALFRIAKPDGLGLWSDLLSEMAQIASVPELKELAHNPRADDAMVAETFLSAMKTALNAEAKNFVSTLVENNRLPLLPEIAAQFQVLKNMHQKMADATIVSAFEMSSVQTADLVAALERKFGCKLNATVTVDPSLIGGVRVIVGDEVLDTSVTARLDQMLTVLAA